MTSIPGSKEPGIFFILPFLRPQYYRRNVKLLFRYVFGLYILIQAKVHLLPKAGCFDMFCDFLTLESLKRDCSNNADIAGRQFSLLDDPVQHGIRLCLYAGLAVCHHKSYNEFLHSMRFII